MLCFVRMSQAFACWDSLAYPTVTEKGALQKTSYAYATPEHVGSNGGWGLHVVAPWGKEPLKETAGAAPLLPELQ